MKHSRFIKAVVLSFFIFFIIGFVAYRSGFFEKRSDESATDDSMKMNSMMASENNTLNSSSVIDSPPAGRRTLMPGSKSMPLTKQKSVYNRLDSPGHKKNLQLSEPPVMFSGSKSGAIIPLYPEPRLPRLKKSIPVPAKEPADTQKSEESIEQKIKKYELMHQRKKDSLNKIKGPNDTVVYRPYFPGSKVMRLVIAPKENKR